MKNNEQSCENCGNYVDEDYFPCNVCNGIINYFSIEKTVPMLCFQHGGSEACEESNKKFGFTCPRCSSDNKKQQIEHLPIRPSKKDLYKFSNIKLKKKRARKKFEKNYYRYISAKIYNEYTAKIMCIPMMRSLNYAELGKKLIMVESL